MTQTRDGQIAVIFCSMRNGADEAGYQAAAAEMAALAATQPGYCGMQSCRDVTGFGITISYWASEADALAWRNQADHAAARQAGRDTWYAAYTIEVAQVTRSYDWRTHG